MTDLWYNTLSMIIFVHFEYFGIARFTRTFAFLLLRAKVIATVQCTLTIKLLIRVHDLVYSDEPNDSKLSASN